MQSRRPRPGDDQQEAPILALQETGWTTWRCAARETCQEDLIDAERNRRHQGDRLETIASTVADLFRKCQEIANPTTVYVTDLIA